jgi:hypothetical protein
MSRTRVASSAEEAFSRLSRFSRLQRREKRRQRDNDLGKRGRATSTSTWLKSTRTDTSKSLDLVFCGVERVSKGDSATRARRQEFNTTRSSLR